MRKQITIPAGAVEATYPGTDDGAKYLAEDFNRILKWMAHSADPESSAESRRRDRAEVRLNLYRLSKKFGEGCPRCHSKPEPAWTSTPEEA